MKPPSDTHAQRIRTLTSEVQRLRDWAGGDLSRVGRVADALVELTAQRLAGHAWGEAAAGAQEAVLLSAKALAQHGPVGPYTPQPDAVRSVTALVHLAVIQSAAGLIEPAGQTLAAAFGLRDQLSRLDLDAGLRPATVAWALLVWARVGLAAGETAAANARADAAASVIADEGWVDLDVDRLVSDARWAAGWPEPAVEYLLRAVERYDDQALAALRQPAALPPALLDRLSEPLFGLYSAAADRLLVIGAPGLALTLRRRLVDLLGTLAVRKPDLQPLLVVALTDLADDLRGTGRAAEAADVGDLATSIAGEDDADRPAARARTPLGAHTSWSPLAPDAAFGVISGASGTAKGRLAALRGPADAEEQQRRVAAEAELAQRAEADAEAAQLRAGQAERQRAEQERLAAQQAEEARLAVEKAAQAAEVERLAKQRRRAERKAEHELQLEREKAEREAALRARVRDEPDAERAEREELERLAAELADLEAQEALRAEREAAELAELERQLALEAEVPLEQGADDVEVTEVTEPEAADEAQRVAEAERERLLAEEAELERAAVAQAELDRQAAEREEADRLAVVAAEAERQRVEAERRAAERAEAERVEADRAEAERLLMEQAEADRVAAERAEQERLDAERVERERADAERQAAEQAEQERVERERAERERQAAEQAEQQRVEGARAEAERQVAEQAERERLERERVEAERGAERAEAERQARAERLRPSGRRRSRPRSSGWLLNRPNESAKRLSESRPSVWRQSA